MTQPFQDVVARTEIPINIPAGNVLYAVFQQANLPPYITGLDFRTVTSVQLQVTREKDRSTVTWQTTNLSNVSASGLVAMYTFAGVPPAPSADVPVDGTYLIRPYLLTSSGPPIPCDRVELYVLTP